MFVYTHPNVSTNDSPTIEDLHNFGNLKNEIIFFKKLKNYSTVNQLSSALFKWPKEHEVALDDSDSVGFVSMTYLMRFDVLLMLYNK